MSRQHMRSSGFSLLVCVALASGACATTGVARAGGSAAGGEKESPTAVASGPVEVDLAAQQGAQGVRATYVPGAAISGSRDSRGARRIVGDAGGSSSSNELNGRAANGRDADGEIMAMLAAIDRAQIEQGVQARGRVSNAQVRAFSEALLSTHGNSSAHRFQIGERINARARETDQSLTLNDQSFSTQERLAQLRDSSFDRAYVNVQVAQQARALDLIDRVMLPAAQDPELRAHLQREVRPALQRNLERARALQTQLRTTPRY